MIEIHYLFLLIIRVGTLVPILLFLSRQIKNFRDPKRDRALTSTRQALFLMNVASALDNIIFITFDVYRAINSLPIQSPTYILLIWGILRVLALSAVWKFYLLLYEKEDDRK